MITMYRPIKTDFEKATRDFNLSGGVLRQENCDDVLLDLLYRRRVDVFPSQGKVTTKTAFVVFKRAVESGKMIPIKVDATLDTVFEKCQNSSTSWLKRPYVQSLRSDLFCNSMCVGDFFEYNGQWYVVKCDGFGMMEG